MESIWRSLEQRVAQYFARNGYIARTNQKEQGRSGLIHELDVLAEKRDAAGVHRVAVECKAWRTPIEKDVIYKLEEVMRDTGLSKGIIVSAGGLRAGARTAADQAHIEVWGVDEIRHLLGEEALAGLPLAVAEEALGVEPTVSRDAAERAIKKARAGLGGIGGEEIASIDLVWLPAYDLQLAVTRVHVGMIRDRQEVIRRWNLYEAITGRLIGQRDDPRAFAPIALAGAVLRPQRSSAQVVGNLRSTIGKHRNAKSEAALNARQAKYNAIGLPGSTLEIVVEREKHVFLPFYVGLLRRKGTERLVAVHGGLGTRYEAVEHALHEKLDVLHRALEDGKPRAPANELLVHSPVQDAPAPATTRAPDCTCGAAMVMRHRKSDGVAFWGCSSFPRCRQTRPA